MPKTLYKPFLLFPFILTAGASGGAVGQELSVLASSASEFHFRVKMHLADLQRRTESDSSVVLFKSVQVGIPYGADVTLVSVQGDSLIPVGDEQVELDRPSRDSYPLAAVSDPVTLRGRQFVVVSIFPLTGAAFYGSVTVRLNFSGGLTRGGVASDDPQFDRIFRATLTNFDQFRTWPVPARTVSKSVSPTEGPFGMTSEWYKIAVNQTGLYRISGSQLAQAGPLLDDLQSDSIHVFNGGGLPLEVQNENPRPTFTEVAVMIDDGGDGVFNSDDHLIFFGEPVDRWLYPVGQAPRYASHPYTDRNIYWLAVSGFPNAGMRMTQIDAAPNGAVDTVITTFRRSVHTEENRLLRRLNDGRTHDYYIWYWTDQPELTFYVPAPGAVDGETADIWLAGRTNDNGDVTDSIGFMDLYVNGIWADKSYCDPVGCTYQTSSLVDGLNEARISLWPTTSARPYFDYLNLEYTSRLKPDGNRLDMPLGSWSGSAEVQVIDNLSFPIIVLNVDDPLHPILLTGLVRDNGMVTFHAELNSSMPNRFYMGAIQGDISPLSIQQTSPADLRTVAEQVDLFLITPQRFVDAIGEYLDYRQDDGVARAVVTMEDIMDNFAYGLYDPTAIRDFLKYAYEHYPVPAPSSVLLVGDGSYDYLDHLGEGVVNYVPPYIHPYDESASDDNYVYFGEYGILDSDTSYDTSLVPQDRGYDMLVARWPVSNVSEISTIVAKSKQYESASGFGLWRTNVTLVADDEFGTYDNETFHTTQTEKLEKEHIPPLFHRDKIYLWDYPFVNLRKPAVNDAIVNNLNQGTLLINYVGHGNPDVWAHEYVFTRTGDVPRLHNFTTLPLFFAASCALGFFDDPRRESMGEDLLVYPDGGGIGVVSATRLVYSSENAQFNRQVFDVLLRNRNLSMCEAVYTAKLQLQYISGPFPRPEQNDRAYLFFGDPHLKLDVPRLDMKLDTVPGRLTALERARVSGEVVDGENQPYPYDGRLLINVYDSEREKVHRLLDDNGEVIQRIEYSVTGPTIFRGSDTITGGRFTFEFITPLDVGYGGQGARVVVYAVFDTVDAAGVIDSIPVSDSIAVLMDSTGPVVTYTFPGRDNFISGGIISREDQLEITASDSSGINLTSGLGHGITLEVDGQSESIVNLTDRFEYAQGDFTTGTVIYPVDGLSPGRHTFKIKVWDNANNSTSVEFAAEFAAEENLAILNLLNYPNPMADSTRFSLELTQTVRNLTLEIFTLSGRKIRSFDRYRPTAGYYDDIVWYGRDNSGDRVATGVYIYRASAVPLNGGKAVESFGKVVVIN